MKKITVLIMIIIALTTAPVFAADITGMVAVITGSGRIVPGAKVNIYLVTKEFQLKPITEPIGSIGRDLDVFEAHSAAFHSFKNEVETNPTYISASTKTNLEGKFKMDHIKPGDYFLLVEGLERIAMNLVFWQIPVIIGKDDIYVEMSNDNMALPPLFVR